MPRYRKLHVKTVESLDINDMPDDFCRLLWVLLPLALCREGRGVYHPAWIKSRVFPLRFDVTREMIGAAFEWYIQRGMIVVYEVDGRAYFYLPTFARYQGNTAKEAASDYPPPSEPAGPPPEPVGTGSGAGQEPVESGSEADPDPDADPDANADADAGAEAGAAGAAASPAPAGQAGRGDPPLTRGQSGFLDLFGARRFRTRPQREAVLELEREHGTEKLLEAARWAAEKGMSLGNAVGAVRTALPTWGQKERGPHSRAGPAASEPAGYAGLRQLAQEEGWEDLD